MKLTTNAFGGFDSTSFRGWKVFRLTGDKYDYNQDVPRGGITNGLLGLSDEVVTTNDFDDGGQYNVLKDTSFSFTPYKNVFFDLQAKKYLYVQVNTSTYKPTLEYSDSAPDALTLAPSNARRYPLAYIDEYYNVIDLRMIVIAGGASAAATVYPFDISIVTNNDLTQSLVLQPGTVNQLLPSNMFERFSYSSPSTIYVALNCLTNGSSLTSLSIGTSLSPSVPPVSQMGTAPSTFSIALGIIVSGSVVQITNGNLNATPTQTMVTQKTDFSVGGTLWDRWYNWVITEQ